MKYSAFVLVSILSFVTHSSCFRFLFDSSSSSDNVIGEYTHLDRHLEIECACGEIKEKDDSSRPFPWHVLISHDDGSPAHTHSSHNHGNETQDQTTNTDEYCSGTIINSKIILTSINCLLAVPAAEIRGNASLGLVFHDKLVHRPDQLKVRVLADSDPSTVHKVEDLFYHPKFFYSLSVYSKEDYDFAMLVLKEPLDFGGSSKAVPICIPNEAIGDKELEGTKVNFAKLVVSGNFDEGGDAAPKDNSAPGSEDNKEAPSPDPSSSRRRRQAPVSISTHVESSFIYNRNKCRVNAQTKWISERFLCSDAPKFGKQLYTEVGSSLYSVKDGIHTQLGIVSWKNYFPIIIKRKPMLLSTSISSFLPKIEEYSKKFNAHWCRKDWNGLPEVKWDNDVKVPNSISEKSEGAKGSPWKELKITSDLRKYRSDCVCGKTNTDLKSQGRIQGGTEAKKYEYGWMVQLIATHNGSKQLCGGAIINSRIVLTAAHCVYVEQSRSMDAIPDEADLVFAKDMAVRVERHSGPSDRDENSRILKVEGIIPHPGYEKENFDNDVALLILWEPIDFTKLKGRVSSICFPMTGEDLDFSGRQDAMIIGWGRTRALEKGSHAHVLQSLHVKVASYDDCMAILNEYKKARHGNYEPLMRRKLKICAGTFSTARDYTDPGQGDSGGPLFIPIKPKGKTNIHIGTASMITMNNDEKFLRSDLKTVTFYADSKRFIDFVDYYSLIADATWCRR